MRLLYGASPCWGGEENQNKKAKPVSWDEDNLTKAAKGEENNNKNTKKKKIQSAIFLPPTGCSTHSRAANCPSLTSFPT